MKIPQGRPEYGAGHKRTTAEKSRQRGKERMILNELINSPVPNDNNVINISPPENNKIRPGRSMFAPGVFFRTSP
ncbi:hypothetical protein NDU88_003084 [Pleurodeles waltl]|uniref:Uncharacterized protein n=1 Tax=Pleurodeles waltl TaxID=8319 RepID=A0AAV7SCS7_PLEWA|nr:hypothetical protein NDU88_003084 [Pleurodeles waltl]